MRDVFRGFYSLPDIQRGEALSSWVCRAAASHLMTPAEFSGYLGVSLLPDLDRAMLDWLWRVAPNLDERRWAGMLLAGRVLEAMIGLEPWCPRPFLTSRRGFAQYAFCPHCIAEQEIYYLRIEWRLRLWCVCPRHHCSMQLHCYKCRTKVETPVNFCRNNFRNVEAPSFGYCWGCGYLLSGAPTAPFPEGREEALTGLTASRRFPEAEFSAALYHGFEMTAERAPGLRAQRVFTVACCGRLLDSERGRTLEEDAADVLHSVVSPATSVDSRQTEPLLNELQARMLRQGPVSETSGCPPMPGSALAGESSIISTSLQLQIA